MKTTPENRKGHRKGRARVNSQSSPVDSIAPHAAKHQEAKRSSANVSKSESGRKPNILRSKLLALQKAVYHTFVTFCKGASRKRGEMHRQPEIGCQAATNPIFRTEFQSTKLNGNGFGDGYRVTADQDAKQANRWRWIALSFMSLTASLGISILVYSLKHPTDWKAFTFRYGLCVVLAVPAFYAAKESANHRKHEAAYRRVQLQLASLEPYLASLPTEQRYVIKARMAQEFFGTVEHCEETDEVSQRELFRTMIQAFSSNKEEM
jgi:hypothetical protein